MKGNVVLRMLEQPKLVSVTSNINATRMLDSEFLEANNYPCEPVIEL